jgi:hypothetical protein
MQQIHALVAWLLLLLLLLLLMLRLRQLLRGHHLLVVPAQASWYQRSPQPSLRPRTRRAARSTR